MKTHPLWRWLAFAFLLTGSGSAQTQDPGVVYFLVAEWPETPINERRDDSYVLPIPRSRTNDLLHARSLIEGQTTQNRIVVASVQVGANGINHNLLDPDLPAWNWHVTEFQRFANNVLVNIDGRPSGVALNPAAWTGIGFIGYTVVRELGETPVLATAQADPEGVKLRWWSPIAGAQFTVETTTSLTQPDWQPLPGAAWPTTAREWIVTDPPAGTYYRVTVGEPDEVP